ncbi:heavy-metal-associated domain-containing protein [Terrisporobacter sp.]
MKRKLSIEGMKCNHCVGNLKDVLTEDINGIDVLEVSLDGKYAIVDMEDSVDIDKMKELIEDLGFQLISVE